MAKRPAWSVQDDVVICENFDFMWSGGFSITQKQKNIRALHQSIIHALFYQEISEVELAKKLGIARTTLQSRKYKILEKLRKLL